MMTETPEKSRPLAATSVHSSTPEALRENSRKVLVRSACTHHIINDQSQYAGAKDRILTPCLPTPVAQKAVITSQASSRRSSVTGYLLMFPSVHEPTDNQKSELAKGNLRSLWDAKCIKHWA